MDISLVVPVFNEEDNVDILIRSSVEALVKTGASFEIILIDDGSTDSTLPKLLSYQKEDSRIKILELSRNFGHQSAYTAGLEHAKGEYVAMMDGDMQDPPEVLVSMYEKIKTDDVDIVYGKRVQREERFIKRHLILAFHHVYTRLSKINQPMNVGNFSIMNRNALNALLSLKEKTRYLPGLRSFIGFKHGYVSYSRKDRAFGAPKMTFKKLFDLALNAIFSFSNIPIRLCFYIGLLGVIMFLTISTITIYHKLVGIASPGWTSTLISIYFFGSVQLIFTGILGEYLYRIYIETQSRSIYFIRKYHESNIKKD